MAERIAALVTAECADTGNRRHISYHGMICA